MSGSFAPPSVASNGFTYDQQSVPSSPSTGNTWRERDSSNNVVEEWYWNGTYWLSENRRILTSVGGAGGSLGTLTNTGYTAFTYMVGAQTYDIWIDKIEFLGVINGTHNSTNNWTIQPILNQNGDINFSCGSKNTFTDFSWGNSSVSNGYSLTTNQYSPNKTTPLTYVSLYCTKNGTPSMLNIQALVLYWRLVR
jgi:hypothetical protein